MKICYISQEYPPETGGGGIGTQTYLKAHGLSARGHEVHVIASSLDSGARSYRDGPVHVHRVGQPALPVPGYEESTYWLVYSMAVAATLHALTKAHAFDIIHFPEYGGEGLIYQTDTFANRQALYVVQMHGPLIMFREHINWPARGSTLDQVGCFMERTVLHHADGLMASSHYTAALCARYYELDVDKICVIHSALDTGQFAPQPQPASDRYPRILFVGTYSGSKGLTALVEAVVQLRAEFPRIHLRAFGRPRPEYTEPLQRRLAEAGATGCVEFAGFLPYERLVAEYAWCDFFAGPSTFEGGPGNVYLEAMSCGRPVIAGNIGGAPEVVRDGQTGYCVNPLRAEDLIGAMRRLTQDPALCRRLGDQARAWALERFTLARYIDRVESTYQEWLAAAKTRTP